MERSYESAATLVGRAVGPLAAHLGAYVASLVSQQYAIDVVYIKARHALAFDRWLGRRGVALGDLQESHISQYQCRSRRHRSRRDSTLRQELRVLDQLLHFLRQQGTCVPVPTAAILPADEMASGFERHLRNERGLARATVSRYTKTARQFLIECFGEGRVQLGALQATDAVEFIQRQTQRMQPSAVKNVVTGLRAFLRYAQYYGEIDAELIASVPTVATWSTTPQLPKAISAEHAQRALDSCDGHTAVGRRDRAVLLLLARLGLRAVEIARLQLHDIDWDGGCLRVRGKGGRDGLLPLPTDVGEAIAAYLANGRPRSEDRHLFLRLNAPIRGIKEGSYGIGSIVRRALRRAHVEAPHWGTHQFRHALAVRLLRHGASLPEIGEVLRHRSPQSTSLYAKVDLETLRTLALAWPGEAP
ncbi:MAG TPA: tyrosine-type recombinase/integrase [Terriglobales bacterium]|nr:tyrosine-type recombinase/integrase [Terriglobales bacterium]